jgi:hypothetical protein
MVDTRPASVVAKSGIERLRIKESVAATIQWLLPGKHDTPLSGMQERSYGQSCRGGYLMATRRLRRLTMKKGARTCAVRIIALTAAGIDDCVVKPLVFDDLVTAPRYS